eukprot:CAMPEP_0185690952 /NCGR_PEP_ID=MMETSP1164-20130828/1472_1 /TAXON_ID=1104430 /ORGANISM="Chrysoreinhardia sp, Strain CCMP2950" /LENGTH=115 /DNA_ID=CAMNT_0028357569 /DNA_START=79 /DNA_END=426 /DNA_ORIENTATION=+
MRARARGHWGHRQRLGWRAAVARVVTPKKQAVKDVLWARLREELVEEGHDVGWGASLTLPEHTRTVRRPLCAATTNERLVLEGQEVWHGASVLRTQTVRAPDAPGPPVTAVTRRT